MRCPPRADPPADKFQTCAALAVHFRSVVVFGSVELSDDDKSGLFTLYVPTIGGNSVEVSRS